MQLRDSDVPGFCAGRAMLSSVPAPALHAMSQHKHASRINQRLQDLKCLLLDTGAAHRIGCPGAALSSSFALFHSSLNDSLTSRYC